MTSPANPTISVIVHRSLVLDQHQAYVRVGGVEAGYRDLRTGLVHCVEPRYFGPVAEATAPLLSSPGAAWSAPEFSGSALPAAVA